MPLRERDLAPAIVAHFEALGYEVFHEIELGGRRADLVAENASELVGIELKLHEWRNALRQTMAYQLAADRAFVALPLRRAQDAHRARHLFDREGVGLLAVGPKNDVRVVLAAAPSPRLLPALTESVRMRLEFARLDTGLEDIADGLHE